MMCADGKNWVEVGAVDAVRASYKTDVKAELWPNLFFEGAGAGQRDRIRVAIYARNINGTATALEKPLKASWFLQGIPCGTDGEPER
jgi:hypothetical protein